MGWKSSPPPPPPPDYTQAAEKTAQSNQLAQTRADWANRPDQITPWGTESWSSSQTIDPATGQPVTKWTQNTTLAPDQQKALDDQMALQSGRSDIASGMMGRLAQDFANPYDWSKMQAYGAVPQAGQYQGAGPMQMGVGGTGLDSRMRLEDAMMERMRPDQDRQQAMLENKLQNMGITRGSEAWKAEMQAMGDQFSRDRFGALQAGLQEQQGQFGMGLQQGQFANQAQQQAFQQGAGLNAQNFGQEMTVANYQNQLRQQQIAEEAQRRGMTLNEMNALISGQQVGMPNMPSFNTSQSAGGTNYSGAAQQQYSAAMDQYNAAQAQKQGMMSGIAGIAGAAATVF